MSGGVASVVSGLNDCGKYTMPLAPWMIEFQISPRNSSDVGARDAPELIWFRCWKLLSTYANWCLPPTSERILSTAFPSLSLSGMPHGLLLAIVLSTQLDWPQALSG